jgi:HlyD family secretion protein
LLRRLRIGLPIALLLVAAATWLYLRSKAGEASPYRFATIGRGNLEAAVSATGTLSAVTTVKVGTQVSGQVSAIYADFNDRVKRGQLIARIDPTLQEQAVREAQAGLERSQAELAKAERDYARARQLHDQQVIMDSEFDSIEYALAVARANAKSARVALDKARQNLAYTSIYAPIDGIVVERDVDVGQTVAASLSAPQLFLIANDLSRMQILASVDESDIGQIHEGQPVRFSVQAYPDTFSGSVRQVRLQSTTTENVVNYTAVVEVGNQDRKLLPGMTATARFLTGSASDALLVPNAALRFRPTEAMLAQVGPASQAQTETRPAVDTGAGRTGSSATLWYIGPNGKLAAARVHTGITDGQHTVVEGEGLRAGMDVITAATQSAPGTATSSPFQSSQQRPGPPPGGF